MSKKNSMIICLILGALFLYWVSSQFAEQVLIWLHVPVLSQGILQAVSTQDYLSWFYVHGPAFLISVLGFVLSYRSAVFSEYLAESIGELQKVSYPQPKEASQSAVAVVLIVAVCVVILGFYDFIWNHVVLFFM